MLTPSQLVKRLRNFCDKNNYHFDSDDIISMFDHIESYDVKSFNKHVKENYT